MPAACFNLLSNPVTSFLTAFNLYASTILKMPPTIKADAEKLLDQLKRG